MSLSTEAPLLKTPCLASHKRRPNKVKMLSKSLLAVTLGAVINHSVMAQTPTEQTQAQPTAAEQVQQPTPQQVISKLAYQAQDQKLPTEQRVQALRELVITQTRMLWWLLLEVYKIKTRQFAKLR